MARHSFRILCTLFVLASVAVMGGGCSNPPPRPVYTDIRFSGEPLRLDVADVLPVEENYKPGFKAPNVEHLFPVVPVRALEFWPRDRLRAAGSRNHARFTILNASVRETELPKTPGLQGTFTREQAQRYDAVIEARLDIVDEARFVSHSTSARVTRSQTVPEGISPNEREKIWYDMTRGLMTEFDQAMEQNIRSNFGTALLR